MRFWRKTVILASMLAAAATVAPAAHAQDARGGIDTLFAGIAADKERAVALVPIWFGQIAEDRVGLYAGFIIQLFRDPAFADYMLDAEGPPAADTDAYVGPTAYAATQTAVDAGMARLPIADETAYLTTGTAFATWVAQNHPESCLRLMTADDPNDRETQALQAEYQNTLPPDAIFAYLDLGYRAILAELDDTPAAEPFSDAQLERGHEAYQAAIEAEVLARPNAQALVAAANFDPTAPAADVCEVMLLTLTVVDTLQPPERDWAIQYIVNQQ